MAVAPLRASIAEPRIGALPRLIVNPAMRSAVIVPRAIALAKTFRYHCKTGTVVLKATCEEGRRWDEPTKRMTNATRANRAAISVAADAMILSARDAGSPRFPASIARSHSPTDRPANPAEPP